MFALAQFEMHNFESALPRVNGLIEASPADRELNRAALVMLVTLGRGGEAELRAAALDAAGDSDFADLYRARLRIRNGDPDGAETLLRPLLDARDSDLAQEAGGELITLLQSEGRYGEVPAVAGRALARDPLSFSAYRLEQYTLENQQALRPFDFSVGYRLEYDDNVALLPDQQGLIFGVPDEEDYRHVLFADLMYAKSLGHHLTFFSEGHVSHSLHQDLDQYDFTRINLLAGLGGSYASWGWRLPVEYTHDRFDGNSFRDSWAVTPGAYLDLWGGLQSHVYLRFQTDDYDRRVSPSEDRSGDSAGGGLLLVGKLGERWFIRAFAEADDIDADGSNWDRQEWRAQASADFQFAANWALGAGFRYQEADFDEIHDVFLARRKDETSLAFASLSYWFREHWQFRAQASYVDQKSTLAVYEFDRTVISLGVSYDF